MNIGGIGFHRVEQACVLVYADVDFYPEMLSVAQLCLMDLGISFFLIVDRISSRD